MARKPVGIRVFFVIKHYQYVQEKNCRG
jgi:hypothetical protein